MAIPHLGEICALSAALCWAAALVLFKRSVHQIAPLQLNIFKNVIGLGLLLVTLAGYVVYLKITGIGLGGFALSRHELSVLIVSGVVGIAIADTLLFVALDLIGVGLMTIVDCTYAPCVLAFSWLILAETIKPIYLAGAGLIFVGVFMATRHQPPPDRTRGQLLAGIAVGALAIASVAFGIVYAKPVLPGIPVVWATIVRLVAALVPLSVIAVVWPGRGGGMRALWRPSPIWRAAIPASVLGNYLSLLFWVAGFKYADASINGILNQTSMIFALVFATVFLKEPLTRRKLAAVGLAFSGAFLVVVFRHAS